MELWHATGANNLYTTNDKFARDESKFCRAIEFSPDGRYLAWANGSKYVNTRSSELVVADFFLFDKL